MAEHFIAIGVGVVVGGGILTLVWRILAGDREEKALEEALDQFKAPDEPADKGGSKPKKNKKKKK